MHRWKGYESSHQIECGHKNARYNIFLAMYLNYTENYNVYPFAFFSQHGAFQSLFKVVQACVWFSFPFCFRKWTDVEGELKAGIWTYTVKLIKVL